MIVVHGSNAIVLGFDGRQGIPQDLIKRAHLMKGTNCMGYLPGVERVVFRIKGLTSLQFVIREALKKRALHQQKSTGNG